MYHFQILLSIFFFAFRVFSVFTPTTGGGCNKNANDLCAEEKTTMKWNFYFIYFLCELNLNKYGKKRYSVFPTASWVFNSAYFSFCAAFSNAETETNRRTKTKKQKKTASHNIYLKENIMQSIWSKYFFAYNCQVVGLLLLLFWSTVNSVARTFTGATHHRPPHTRQPLSLGIFIIVTVWCGVE